MDNDFYLAELVSVKPNVQAEVRSFIKSRKLDVSLVVLTQTQTTVKTAVKGSVIQDTDNFVLETYCFLQCKKDADVISCLNALRRSMSAYINVIKFAGEYAKLSPRDVSRIEDMIKQTQNDRPLDNITFKSQDEVKLLKGRYMGHVGWIVTDPNSQLHIKRKLEAVYLTQGITVDVPRVYLQKNA